MQIDDVMALVDEYVSASIEDHGYRSGAASAEYLEDTKRKLLAAIAALIAAPAAPQQAEPVLNERVGLAYKNGYEEALNDCIRNGGEAWARSMFANGGEHIKPQQAEPVAQIGWSDEFGNLFPMAAWKPAQRTHHDSHKTAWRPVFLHQPAAEVQRLRAAALALLNELDAGRHGAHEFNNLRNALRGE